MGWEIWIFRKKQLKRMVRETEILSILAPSGMRILTKPQSKKN